MGRHKKNNVYVIDKEKQIVVGKASNTQNEFIFDLEYFDKIKDMCWYETNNGYIMHKGLNGSILLHRFVLDFPQGKVVDHINHNRKDNRKQNLRICTQKENVYNRTIKSRGKLKEFGISTAKRNKNLYYIVDIGNQYRGCYKDIELAKKCRDLYYNKVYGNHLD